MPVTCLIRLSVILLQLFFLKIFRLMRQSCVSNGSNLPTFSCPPFPLLPPPPSFFFLHPLFPFPSGECFSWPNSKQRISSLGLWTVERRTSTRLCAVVPPHLPHPHGYSQKTNHPTKSDSADHTYRIFPENGKLPPDSGSRIVRPAGPDWAAGPQPHGGQGHGAGQDQGHHLGQHQPQAPAGRDELTSHGARVWIEVVAAVALQTAQSVPQWSRLQGLKNPGKIR